MVAELASSECPMQPCVYYCFVIAVLFLLYTMRTLTLVTKCFSVLLDCKRQCDPGFTLDTKCFVCLCHFRIYTGIVRSARDKTPIMGADIRNLFDATVLYSVTSKNGSFSFPGDCDGADVMVIKPGYTGMNGTLTDAFVEISLARMGEGFHNYCYIW